MTRVAGVRARAVAALFVFTLALASSGLSGCGDSENQESPGPGNTSTTTPAAPSELSAASDSATTIALAWQDNSDDEDEFLLERGESKDSFEEVATLDKDSSAYTDKKLTPATTYYYRLRARNDAGSSDASNVAKATTADPPDIDPPDAPSDLSAEAVSAAAIELAWQDNADNEDGFVVERGESADSLKRIATLAKDLEAFADVGLEPATTYYYRVSAQNQAGLSDPTDIVNATTEDAPDVEPPPFLFSEEWAEIWRQARADGHPWAELLFDRADATGTKTMHASDNGLYAVMAYLISGDVGYADKAWTHLGSLDKFEEQALREYLTQFALSYYALRDYWALPGNEEKRATFIAWMNDSCDTVFGVLDKSLRDSDVVTGALGIFVWALASREHNDRAEELLQNPVMGELDATASDLSNVRNAISLFAEHAQGGAWIESRHYNEGTLTLLAMGTEGIRALTGVDHFPEVAQFYPEAALHEIYSVTPDLAETYYWGDEEHAREFVPRLWRRVTMLGMLAGLTQNDAVAGPYVHQFILDLAEKYGHVGFGTTEPWERFFLLYNPYAGQADYSALPLHHDAAGMGFSLVRESWDEAVTGMLVHANNPPHVDHEVPYVSDVHLHRKGEWLLTRPGVWGGHPYSNNTFLFEGLGMLNEWTGRLAAEYDASGRYTYVVAGTGGNWAWDEYYEPPPTFVHEATRALWFSPCPNGKCTVLVTHDRLNTDPLTEQEKYQPVQQGLIDAHPNKKIVFHTPVEAKLDGATASWTTAEGQELALHFLTPGFTLATEADTQELVGGVVSQETELKYAVLATPDAERKWDTLVSVFSAADAETSVTANAVQDDSGTEGVHLVSTGNDDLVVMFSALSGPDLPPATIEGGRLVADPEGVKQRVAAARLLKEAFSFAVTTEGAADVYLTDLDPAADWAAMVDGVDVTLSVSSAGVGYLRLDAGGPHSVELSP